MMMISIDGSKIYIEKAIEIMKILYKIKRNSKKSSINKNDFYNTYSEQINLESKKEFEDIIDYLLNQNYLDEDSREDYYDFIFLSKIGVDEVENEFPVLNRELINEQPLVSSMNDLFIKIDEQGFDIKTEIDKIKNMERYLEDLKIDMEFIKVILEERLPEIKDEDVKEIIINMLSSGNPYIFLTYAYKLAKNPKTKDFFKEILEENIPLALPPRAQI